MTDLWRDPSFLSVIDALGECVLTLDADGRVTGCRCPGAFPLLESGRVEGKLLGELLPAEATSALGVALATLVQAGTPQRLTFELEVGGERRAVQAKLGRLSLAGGQTLVLLLDVTAHALAREAQEQADAYHRLFAENTSDVISVRTLEGRCLYISPSVERLTGFSPGELVGRLVRELWHPEDLARATAGSSDGCLTPPPEGIRVRHRVRHRDERWIWVETDARLITWRGEPAVICDTRDISRRREAEERAAEVLEELRQERAWAEAASQAKSEFLASMSHSLRTPLHGILGMTDLLEQTRLGDEQRQYLEAIRDSGKALHALLNDLQDLSKIESRSLDLEAVPFDLVEAVEGLADILGREASQRGIELQCEVAPDVPTMVVGDPQRLRQVLMNLVAGSLQGTGAGTVSVLVRRGHERRIRFEVHDTGALPAVVDAAALPAPRPSDHGASLMVSIARGLVELMGGELGASAHGSSRLIAFELRLPVSDQVPPLAERGLQGLRLLLAESSAAERLRLRDALEQAGAEVEVASGGVEVIRTLRDEPRFDCVVLDAAMPDLDGVAVASIIRTRSAITQVPVLVTAANGELPVEGAAALNGVLAKPVAARDLISAVRAVLGGGHLQAEPGGENRTVLVVEDNELNLRLARDVLRRAGYRVLGARGGKEALEHLRRQPVDAVLMDIELPDLDGLAATAEIRKLPGCAGVPIIAMTAHAMKGDAERFLRAGLDDYLSKPVDRRELLEVLGREIRRRGAPASAHGR